MAPGDNVLTGAMPPGPGIPALCVAAVRVITISGAMI